MNGRIKGLRRDIGANQPGHTELKRLKPEPIYIDGEYADEFAGGIKKENAKLLIETVELPPRPAPIEGQVDAASRLSSEGVPLLTEGRQIVEVFFNDDLKITHGCVKTRRRARFSERNSLRGRWDCVSVLLRFAR